MNDCTSNNDKRTFLVKPNGSCKKSGSEIYMAIDSRNILASAVVVEIKCLQFNGEITCRSDDDANILKRDFQQNLELNKFFLICK